MGARDDVARMLTLVPWLLERPGASVAETAEVFGVGEERIRRDLYHLDFCGLPGLGGGDLFEVSIVGDRVVVRMADELREPLRLTPDEALRLVLAGEAVAAALGDRVPQLRSALTKLRAAAGVPAGVSVDLEEDGTHWLQPLQDAVETGNVVRFAYQGRGDEIPGERRVDPWNLVVARGRWYLQGRDHDADELRTFRLDRMVSVDVTSTLRLADPPGGELPDPRYEPSPGDLEIEVVLEAGSRWVAELVEPDTQEELSDGRLGVRFHTDAAPWIRRVLLSAGGGVTVRAPQHLAREVAEEAGRALARYR